jgi:integrase
MRNMLIKFGKIIFLEIGNKPAADLSPVIIDRYLATRKRSGIKNTTIHRELSDIIAILNWSVSRRYLGVNPLAGYNKPRRDDDIIQPPSVDRVIALSFFAGIRPGAAELLPISWDAVNWHEKTLFIKSAQKGGLTTRLIPLRYDLLVMLYRWQRDDRKMAAKNKIPMTSTIGNYRGGPVKDIKKAFGYAKKKAKITRRLRPHDFRHAFATMILSGRGDLKSTSELLGHTRTDTTTRIYQHTNGAMHRAAVDILPTIDPTIQNVLT